MISEYLSMSGLDKIYYKSSWVTFVGETVDCWVWLFVRNETCWVELFIPLPCPLWARYPPSEVGAPGRVEDRAGNTRRPIRGQGWEAADQSEGSLGRGHWVTRSQDQEAVVRLLLVLRRKQLVTDDDQERKHLHSEHYSGRADLFLLFPHSVALKILASFCLFVCELSTGILRATESKMCLYPI